MNELLYEIPSFLMPLIIVASSFLFIISLLNIRKIIHTVPRDRIQFFWKCIVAIVFLFFISYLIIAFLIYMEPLILLYVLIALVCLFGSCFVYVISTNSLKVIIRLSLLNNQLRGEVELQKQTMDALRDKTEAVAYANARMAELYLDLEEKKTVLEEKEAALQKKNEEISKVNYALANANSNISGLYVELEEIKDQLMEKKEELLKKNKILSKSNVMLADTFKKFVPEQFLNKIAKEGIENISGTGYAERVHITVAFSDIRSFTNFSEAREPRDILTVLNKYFSDMSHQIYINHGFIDKFIGDAIMALFETTEESHVSHATNSLNAAIGMQSRLSKTNDKIVDLLGFPLKIGIGIHSGEVILGTVGYEDRMESTVLGSTVNVASRIEALTKYFAAGIIMSKSSVDLLDDLYKYQYRDLGFNSIRGIQNKIHLFEFFDGDSEDKRVLKHNTREHFSNASKMTANSLWQEAINEYEQSLKVYPDDVAAQYLLDQALQELKSK